MHHQHWKSDITPLFSLGQHWSSHKPNPKISTNITRHYISRPTHIQYCMAIQVQFQDEHTNIWSQITSGKQFSKHYSLIGPPLWGGQFWAIHIYLDEGDISKNPGSIATKFEFPAHLGLRAIGWNPMIPKNLHHGRPVYVPWKYAEERVTWCAKFANVYTKVQNPAKLNDTVGGCGIDRRMLHFF